MNKLDMSDMRRPVGVSRYQTPQTDQSYQFKKRKNIRVGIFLTFIIILAVVFCITYVIIKSLDKNSFVKRSEWQAVFLNNGQTYFGKVNKENNLVVVLENIYYLQSNMNLQSSGKDLKKQGGEFALIKLGNEIHGPYDEMFINKSSVNFIENLKANSKIVKAIESYENK